MIDIENMDKKTVHDVMLDLLYSVNVGWFKLENRVREAYLSLNKDRELKQFLTQLLVDLGRYEAKRLISTLDLKEADIDSLIKLLKYSHWFAFENTEVEKLTDKCFRMRTIDCTTQKGAKKRGDQYYDCTTGSNQLCRQAYLAELNGSAQVKKIFAPPDPVPAGTDSKICCEWEITID